MVSAFGVGSESKRSRPLNYSKLPFFFVAEFPFIYLFISLFSSLGKFIYLVVETKPLIYM